MDGTGPGGADAPGASLTAPMPGTVVKVLVGEGDEVEEGQVLLVLEAMKMEQPVAAPHAGRIASLPYGEALASPARRARGDRRALRACPAATDEG